MTDIRLNVGGSDIFPPSGVDPIWSAAALGITGTAFVTTQAVDVSTDPKVAPMGVYQSCLRGGSGFSVGMGGINPITNQPFFKAGQSYDITLHFAEIDPAPNSTRAFDILVNGNKVLSAFDPGAAAGGPFKAVTRTVSAQPDGQGNFIIAGALLPGQMDALLCGIHATESAPVVVVTQGPPDADIVVHQGDNFQKALDSVKPGQTIRVDAGATFTPSSGSFILRNKGDGGDWINIDSSQLAALPERRASMADIPLMPTFVTNGKNLPVFKTEPGAHRYRRRGLHIAPAAPTTTYVANLIEDGDASSKQNTLASVPFDLEWDRSVIHAYDRQPAKRGIALNSANERIARCFIANIKLVGQDCAGIGMGNGPGPYFILDDYIEASCENILSGGFSSAIPGLVPSDVLIEDCDLEKRLSWRRNDPTWDGVHWSIKNIFEMKCGERFKLNRCRFRHAWGDGQPGIALSLKCADTGGSAPWTRTNDILITNCEVYDVDQLLTVAGQHDIIHHVTLVNVLAQRVSKRLWGDDLPLGTAFQLSGVDGINIHFVTYDADGTAISFVGGKGAGDVKNLIFTDNVGPLGGYGIMATGSTPGVASLASNAPGYVMERNYFYGLNPKFAALHPQGSNQYTDPPGYHPNLPVDLPAPSPPAPAPAPAPIPPVSGPPVPPVVSPGAPTPPAPVPDPAPVPTPVPSPISDPGPIAPVDGTSAGQTGSPTPPAIITPALSTSTGGKNA